jgi:hypothetical protein
MIFDLSLEPTLAHLDAVETCPDGIVDLTAVSSYIREWSDKFSIEYSNSRSAVVRLVAAAFDTLVEVKPLLDEASEARDELCRRLALSIVIAKFLCDASGSSDHGDPASAMNRLFGPIYMARLELDLRSVPYWLREPTGDGVDRAYIDISGCPTISRFLSPAAETGVTQLGSQSHFIRGAWIELFRKIREDRAQLGDDEPKYLYDATDWRPWWLNEELPNELEDDNDDEDFDEGTL